MPNIMLLLYKDGKAYDISQLAESIVWKGRKGSAARSLAVTLIDDSSGGNQSADIDPANGDHIVFYYQDTELFRGIVMSQQRSHNFKMPVVAYDNGIYLANNKDTFVYENKTLQNIFTDVCNRFQLKYSFAAFSSYRIPSLTKSKTTAWDVIQDAASQEFKATGLRYFVHSSKGWLSLVKRKDNLLRWVLESGNNIISYNYKKSIENVSTRLKIYSDQDSSFAVRKNSSLENKIGVFQDIQKKDDKLNSAQLDQFITENLKKISTPDVTLSVDAFGIPDVISGSVVYTVIPRLNIDQSFYVDQDTHTFKNGSYTMNLSLNSADI